MCISPDELYIIQDEMEDRFGKLPEEVVNLIHVVEIRELCHKKYIDKLECGDGGISFSIFDKAPPDFAQKIIKKISMQSAKFKFQSNSRVSFVVPNNRQNRYETVKKFIRDLFSD
jgi:transcription-repair coupling factor (superfamily II helicase)